MTLKRRKSQDAHSGEEEVVVESVDIVAMTPKTMKVVELRETLLAKGLSSKGLKKDLIERLEGYLEEASSLNTQSHLSQEITDKEDCNDKVVKLSASPIKSPLDSRQSRQTVQQMEFIKVTEEVVQGSDEEQHGQQPDEVPSHNSKDMQFELPNPLPEINMAKEGSFPQEPKPAIGSNVVCIRNFVRPFALPSVKDLISQFGDVQDFWMDSMRTHCFVVFDTVEGAEDCVAKLAGLKWPPETGKCLDTRFSTVREMTLEKEAGSMQTKDHIVEREKEPLALDQLFMKTMTTPCLYYLPVQRT